MLNRMRYLRVSLLTNCNLNCFYCSPSSATARTATAHNIDSFKASIRLLYRLGVRKVRFTGGEPTLYKKLPELIAFTKAVDDRIATGITTNGLLLCRLAPELADAGLDSVNISLDTLDNKKFKMITGSDSLKIVLAGIDMAVPRIPKVKLNCVIMKDVNDAEVEAMVAYANALGVEIRFIEYMPTRFNVHQNRGYLAGDVIKDRLPYQLSPIPSGPSSAARYYTSPELDIRVGFINPVSHPFCTGCDRVRLASDGQLFGCLFSGEAINLFELLQASFEIASKQIEQLLASKRYLGCPAMGGVSELMPSFVNSGG